ncbi:glycoprotein N [Athtab bunya-like virus]|uniref:glycoprotein N n=1 Tax=Athtab bunya-like virus TaxID=2315724 RepID=UPI000F0CC6FB|nr:glycoprotein N [Athtab bunya-like virus]AYK39330.1 glycoprotein N [Athtab bunya-like virus]
MRNILEKSSMYMLILLFVELVVSSGVFVKTNNCTSLEKPQDCEEFGELGGVHWARLKDRQDKYEIQAKLSGPVCTGFSDPILIGDSRFSYSVDGQFRSLSGEVVDRCSQVENDHFPECGTAVVSVCHLIPIGNCELKVDLESSKVHVSGKTSGPLQYVIQINEEVDMEGHCLNCEGFSRSYPLQEGLTTYHLTCNRNSLSKTLSLSKSEVCARNAQDFYLGFHYKWCMNAFWYKTLTILFFLVMLTACVPMINWPIHMILNKLIRCCSRSEAKVKVTKAVPSFLFLIWWVVLLSHIVYAEASLADSLKEQGFKPETVDFKGLYRTTVPEADFELISTGTGEALRVESFDIKLSPGYALGLVVDNVELDLKVKSVRAQMSYKDCYSTGDTKIISKSTDTCTESCDKCVEELVVPEQVLPENVVKVAKSSSWACDGAGCLSMATGCTCGYCYMTLTGPVWKVCDLELEKVEINLCFNIGGKGMCKWLESVETFADGLYQINLKTTKIVLPERVAEVMEEGKKIRKIGLMNKLGEFDSEFGDFQVVDAGSNYEKDLDYIHECHFTQHRRITFKSCGQNHFYKHKNLHPCQTCFDGAKGMDFVDRPIGEAQLKLNLPLLGLSLKEDKVDVSKFKISSCKGCRNCQEGMACKISFETKQSGRLPIKCDSAQSRNYLLAKIGKNTLMMTFFTDLKEGVLKCELGMLKSQVNFKTEPGKLLLEDFRRAVDRSLEEDYHCQLFSCTMGRFLYNVFGLKGLWHYLWIIFIFVILLVVVVKLVKLILNRATKRSMPIFKDSRFFKPQSVNVR